MKTMINIRADRDVKIAAQKTAAELGIPLSTIINAYLRQFNRTKAVYFQAEEELKSSVKKRLARLHKDVVAGKNLSPVFTDGRDMDKYLGSF